MFVRAKIERSIGKRGTEMTKRKSHEIVEEPRIYLLLFMCVLGMMSTNQVASAQVDQGAITGTVRGHYWRDRACGQSHREEHRHGPGTRGHLKWKRSLCVFTIEDR